MQRPWGRTGLVRWTKGKEACVSGAEWVRRREGGEEGREGQGRSCRVLGAAERTLVTLEQGHP